MDDAGLRKQGRDGLEPRSFIALIAASAMMVPTFTLFLVVASLVGGFSAPLIVLTGVLYGLFAAVVAAVIMVLYAMPFYLFLTWMEWDNLYTCLLIALAPSLVVAMVAEEYSRADLAGFIGFLLHSLVAAITFWWVARPVSTEPD